MQRIAKLAVLAVLVVVSAGCEETVTPPGTADNSAKPAQPLDLSQGNSVLGGAIRAAESTEDRINEHQDRLNRMMNEDQ